MIPNQNDFNKTVERIASSVMGETLIRCKKQRIPESKRPSIVSANNARAVCVYAIRRLGTEWVVGVIDATASNRPFRENERQRRATVATVEPLTLHPPDSEYSVRFHPRMERHFVAMDGKNIVDATGWRWRSDDGVVKAPSVVCIDVEREVNFLDNADVEEYSVHVVPDEPAEFRLLSATEIRDVVIDVTSKDP